MAKTTRKLLLPRISEFLEMMTIMVGIEVIESAPGATPSWQRKFVGSNRNGGPVIFDS